MKQIHNYLLKHIRSFVIKYPLINLCALWVAIYIHSWLYTTDFNHVNFGTRVIGLSETSCAFIRDIQSINNNPAGISFIDSPVIFTQISKPHIGLKDGSNMSVFIIAFSHQYEKIATLAYSLQTFILHEWYQEYLLSLSVARKILPHIFAGVSIKPLFQHYILNDEYTKGSKTFDYGRKNYTANLSIDQGVIVEFSPNLHLGLSLINLMQPNIGLHTVEPLPLTFKTGVSIKYLETNAGVDFSLSAGRWKLSIGLEHPFTVSEYELIPRIGAAIGTRNYFNCSLGVTAIYKHYKLEYAFSLPKISHSFGSHHISFVYNFSPKIAKITEGYIPAEEFKEIKDERDALKLQVDSLTKRVEKLTSERTELLKKIAEIETKMKTLTTADTIDTLRQITELESKIHELEKELESTRLQLKSKTKELEEANKKINELKARPITQEPRVPEEQPVVTAQPRRPSPPPGTPKVRTHKVSTGETLLTIAQRYYGDANKWTLLYNANKDKIPPTGQILPGQILIIP